MESMKMTVIHFKLKSFSKAFTLIELIVVMSIMMILMTMVTPMVSSIVESNNLSRAGQLVADQIRLARQMASAGNRTVEVRLIQAPALSSTGYSAIQLWTATPPRGDNTTETMKQAGKAIALPQSTVISQDSTALSMLLSNVATTNTMPSGGIYSNAPYAAFQIRPSGAVTPTMNMNVLYLTIVPSRYATQTTLPKNYAIVQINSNTGTPLLYRP